MTLSPNFTLSEGIKSQAAIRLGIENDPPLEVLARMKHTANAILEPVRAHFKVPFAPTSFYRSIPLNRAIGSKDTSQHTKGEAVDIEVPGVSNYALACWIRDNLEYDQLILENYKPGQPSSGWVHVAVKDKWNRKETLTFTGKEYLPGLVA